MVSNRLIKSFITTALSLGRINDQSLPVFVAKTGCVNR